MSKESWNTRIGVIMAVAAGSVGLGNFLRFPGQVAQFGGGAFMIAYFVSFIIIGLPIGWAEWTIGRHGGRRGFFACPGIFSTIWKNRLAKYFGVIGTVVAIGIFSYYIYVQAWCLGYAANFLAGKINFTDVDSASAFWANFVGAANNGAVTHWGIDSFGLYVVITFSVNIIIICKGLSKGIEFFTTRAIPTLIFLAIILLIRVLTLGTPVAENPQYNVNNGLGFMWNPTKLFLQTVDPSDNSLISTNQIIGDTELANAERLVQNNPEHYQFKKETVVDQLKKPRLWLAAGGQIFFSLCIGAGVILVYASYMKENDDVVLSNLTSMSANEFCEVGLGGLITIPAAYAFFGAAGVAGQGIFALGFNVLPMVFKEMPMGHLFGFLFFFLLFLASISGTLAMLQAALSFLRETITPGRKRSLGLLTIIAAAAALVICWFTKDLKAMDTVDFWVTNVLMFLMAGFEVILFGWILGIDNALAEANRGAAFPVPRIFRFIIKYVTPLFLLTVFLFWLILDVFGAGGTGIDYHIVDLFGSSTQKPNMVAWMGIGILIGLILLLSIIVSRVKKYNNIHD